MSKKQKSSGNKYYKEEEYEIDDEEENEESEGGNNEYEKDGFVVDDDEAEAELDEEGNYNQFNQNNNVDNVIMEDLVDSDYEIMDEKVKKKEGRLKKKSKTKAIEYENEEEYREKESSSKKISKKQYKDAEEGKEQEYSEDNEESNDQQGQNQTYYNHDRHYKRSLAQEIFGVNEEEIIDDKGEEKEEEPEEQEEEQEEVDDVEEGEQVDDGEQAEIGEKGEEKKKKKKDNRKKKLKNLKNVFDEEEIEEEFATEKDLKIVKSDIPERIQKQYKDNELKEIQEMIKNNPDEFSKRLEYEAEWMIDKIRSYKQQNINPASLKKRILAVLEFYKKEFFDIPFIVYYRRMYFETELSQIDIWKIYELDKEFNKFIGYKDSVRRMFNSIKQFFKNDDKQIAFLEQKFLETAKTIKDLNDLENYIILIKEMNNAIDLKEKARHGPVKKSFIQQVSSTKLPDFARSFSLSTYELAINLELLNNGENFKLLKQPDEPLIKPKTAAFDKLKELGYEQEIILLTNVCRFLAAEIANYPYIKSFARKFFNQYATLTTTPTDEGKKELEALHPSYRVKRIIKKPIDSFDNDLFLDIVENEKLGFITVIISIEDNEMTELINKIQRAYLRSESNSDSPNTEEWNLLRGEAIRVMINDFLIPDLKKEAHSLLLEKAENYVIKMASNSFHSILSLGPYVKSDKSSRDNYDEDRLIMNEDNTPIVMSFVLDGISKATYCVIVDEKGELLDLAVFNHLCQKSIKYIKPEEKNKFNEDKAKLRSIREKFNVDLIVIGANDLNCRFLKEQITEVETEVAKSTGSQNVWITYGDLSVAKVFANSTFADKNLKSHNLFVRQAISLARFKQNPMAETLLLWNDDISKNFCLQLNLHPFQKYVNQGKLFEALEIEAQKVSSIIGIEINRIYDHPHLVAPLQFIAGLGSRKARALLEKVIKRKGIRMRNQLFLCNDLEKRIYLNCIAFLKVTRIDEKTYDLLDGTRIHPESYSIANKLAVSAVDQKNENGNYCVEEILKDPKKLQVLDLNEYIKRNEEKGNVSIRLLINLINFELQSPFRDPRPPHSDLTSNEIFYLLINDTPSNFDVGHIVLARVTTVEDQHVKCRLDNELEATVWIKDIFEEGEIPDARKMKEKYIEGFVFPSRIKSIKTTNERNFKVDLTCKPSELSNHKNFVNIKILDPCFKMVEQEDFKNRHYIQETKTEIKKYQARNIKHPHFKNMNFINTIEYLSERNTGDFIFRPSSKGPNNLTLTWKFYKHTYSHIDIVEDDKPPGASIGSKLYINGDLFYTLQEIIERYVRFCEKLVNDAVNHRKFVPLESMEELEEKLKEERAKDSKTIHYLCTILREYPQYILIGYIPRSNSIVKEFIKVKPKGLFFHNEYFENLEAVINFFKKNYGSDDYKSFVRRTKPPQIESIRSKKFENEYNGEDKNENWEGYANWENQAKKSPSANSVSRNFGNYERNNEKSYSKSNYGGNTDKICFNCNEVGHISSKCPNPRNSQNTRRDYGGERRNYRDDRNEERKSSRYDDRSREKYTGHKRGREEDYNSAKAGEDWGKSRDSRYNNDKYSNSRNDQRKGNDRYNSGGNDKYQNRRNFSDSNNNFNDNNNYESNKNNSNSEWGDQREEVKNSESINVQSEKKNFIQEEGDDWNSAPPNNYNNNNFIQEDRNNNLNNNKTSNDDDWGNSATNNNNSYSKQANLKVETNDDDWGSAPQNNNHSFRNEDRSNYQRNNYDRDKNTRRGGRGSNKGGSKACFKCNEEGHFANSCPNK